MKKKRTKEVPVGTQGIFPAEEILKIEQGTFWSGAAKASPSNMRKQ